jgi:RNA polymerase sigma factor (sigma-70 family)
MGTREWKPWSFFCPHSPVDQAVSDKHVFTTLDGARTFRHSSFDIHSSFFILVSSFARSMPPTISLLLIDDHFVVRSGLVASLELEDDLQVVGESDRGEDASGLFAQKKPEVVLMDLQLPGLSGIDATAVLLREHPSARVLIFSTFARDDEIHAALKAGALGYLQKSSSRDALLAAIRTVARGERSLPADIEKRLQDRLSEPEITPREREILTLVTRGNANKEIAATLGISEDTVKQHVSRILMKLKVNDRAQATAEAIRRGLVSV